MRIQHVFLWRVSGARNAPAVLNDSSALGEAVAGVFTWSIGQRVGTERDGSTSDWQYVLICDFEDQAAFDEYRANPVHVVLAQAVFGPYTDWVVVDQAAQRRPHGPRFGSGSG